MESETDLAAAGRPLQRVDRIDFEIAAIAERQHGVISLRQLVGLGLSGRAVRHRAAGGKLHRIHRCVYAVGHRKLSVQGWRMAAVLFGGEGAVLSHNAAGAEWGLRSWSGGAAITVPKWRRSTDRIAVHSSPLPADEVTVCDGIPITTVPRTLLDLATVLDRHALLAAINVAEAGRERYADSLSWAALLERHRGERGAGRFRAALSSAGFAMGVSEEGLEEPFTSFVAERGLPEPLRNASIVVDRVTYRPDCFWPKQRLIVELKSVKWHSTTQAITTDSTRDRRLMLAGYKVIHVTWAQLHDREQANELEHDLRLALGLPLR